MTATMTTDPRPPVWPLGTLPASHKAAMIRHAITTGTPTHLAVALQPGFHLTPVQRHIGERLHHWGTRPDAHNARLLISAPPRTGKSELAVIWSAIWLAARHPRASIVIACRTRALALRHGTRIRSILKDHGELVGLPLKRGSNRQDLFETVPGASIRILSMDSQTSGFDADFFLCDDPHEAKDFESSTGTIPARCREWFRNTVIGRMMPHSRLLVSVTRWSTMDLGEFILTDMGDRWEYCRLPALADTPNDPLGREIGEGLPLASGNPFPTWADYWHDKRAEVIGIKTAASPALGDERELKGEAGWNALYQQKPSTGNRSLITARTLATVRLEPPYAPATVTVMAIDPSLTADGGGDNCGIITACYTTAGYILITHDDTGHYGVTEWLAKAAQLAIARNVDHIIVEGNQGGAVWPHVLTEEIRPHLMPGHIPPPIAITTTKASKAFTLGANGLSGHIMRGKVYTAGHLPGLEKELLEFNPAKVSPGAADAAATAVTWLIENTTTPDVPITPADPGVQVIMDRMRNRL